MPISQSTHNKRAVVIGGGISGLATAALLAKSGLEVVLLEKNHLLGGRAMVKKAKGFTFDMGPSWYLMPEVFDRYFGLLGKKTRDYYFLKKLNPGYRLFFSDKSTLDISSDKKKNLDKFEKLEPGAKEKISQYLDKSEHLYKLAMDKFLYTSFISLKELTSINYRDPSLSLDMFTSLDRYVKKFTSNDKIQKTLEYTNVFLGGSPKNTPALFSLMSHLDFNQGVFFPKEGIFKVIDALVAVCKEYQVKIITDSPVDEIKVVEGKAAGVKVGKKQYDADIVISSADYPFTETKLLKEPYQTYPQSYWDKKTIAPSAFLMYLGVKGKVKSLSHHNIFFASDWEKHFNDIFKHPGWPESPSIYVSCPSKTDPSVAPKGCENLVILVPVAAGLDDNDTIKEWFSNYVLDWLEQSIGEKIKSRLIYKSTFSQSDYSSLYNAHKGTALGLSHTLLQSAIFRPKNKSKKVSNLYYTGQYTLPGIGLPMCLISAEVVTNRILSENR